MKKTICILSAAAIMAAPMSVSALSAPTTIDESTASKQGQTNISANVSPAYIVTIPADTTVAYGATETDFGSVELTSARLEPNKSVFVTVECDKELNNSEDATKIIPYTIMGVLGTAPKTDASGKEFPFSKTGDKMDLTIEITAEDWNKAYAGAYSDTVTFKVQYKDTTV